MRDLRISEIMTTHVVSVRDDASLSNIDWEMTLAEVRHIPVVDDAGHLLGLVSDRDLLRNIARAERSRLPVSYVMSAAPLTVRPDDPALAALEVLLTRKVGAVPVVDDAGHLIGIVTSTDFLNLAYRALRGIPIDAPHVKA
ncbi:MAG: CBS domain-containing protein [Kofleriaceae bacterium]|nr:MAG: CBS domain-containing protein [Kofleriaceae bacterium]MBZ0233745.1 CBS domain-containing protein [Kofleriaceae bacterium]